ncbi:DUF1127 domain-containing protein [Saccharospirillum sp. HFRX-1]|uniref:DUF1127 domain-containing protein n=1 Tax=unclassified Saccharospirillum TaxID=2633430 RepID=UPI003711100B
MSTQTTLNNSLAMRSTKVGWVFWKGRLARMQALLRFWQRRIKTRRQLKRLPTHLYRDVGLKPHEVQQEVHRSFWQ